MKNVKNKKKDVSVMVALVAVLLYSAFAFIIVMQMMYIGFMLNWTAGVCFNGLVEEILHLLW